MSPLDSDEFAALLTRVRAEFIEMPGLSLTVAQAARLWSLDAIVCAAILSALVDARFLVNIRRAEFARAD